MENVEKNRFPILLAVLAVAASLAQITFLPFLALIVPALFAAVMAQSSRFSVCLLLFVPVVAVSLLFSGGSSVATSLSLAALQILPAFAIVYCQFAKKGGFNTALSAGALSIFALYCAVCLRGILSGDGAFADVTASAKATSEAMIAWAETYRTPETAAAVDQMVSQLSQFAKNVQIVVVPVVCALGSILGLSNTLFFYLFIRKQRESLGLRPLSRFSEWSVPRYFTGGMVILVVFSLILFLTDSDSAAAVSSTVTTLFSIPFTVQALSLIDFMILRSGRNVTAKRAVIFSLCAILLPLFNSIFVMMGCFEQIMHLRQRLSGTYTPPGGKGDFQ